MSGNGGGGGNLWEWQYLIFVLPFAVGALLLLLSSMRFGGGHGHHSFGHHGGHVSAAPHIGAAHPVAHTAHAPSVAGHAAGHPQPRGSGGNRTSGARVSSGVTPLTLALLLLGVGRAPLPMVIEFFLICWGVAGFWAVENLVRSAHPNIFQMIPALAVALGFGLVGSRIAAEVVGRILPQDETFVVSGDALYGLIGTVVYTVSETAGRVHVYDEFGTLHDESCRVAAGRPEIAKGTPVMIADRDATTGRLIVEVSTTQPRRDA